MGTSSEQADTVSLDPGRLRTELENSGPFAVVFDNAHWIVFTIFLLVFTISVLLSVLS